MPSPVWLRSRLLLNFILIPPLLAWYFRDSIYVAEKDDKSFDWASVKPSPNLNTWTTCYDGFDCARLEVPVDWKNSSNSNKVVIAVAKLSASVNPSDASFGGTIVLNPGGPGGSGVDFLTHNGKEIQEMLDGEKHFEILSFDPRGVHNTLPSVSCFTSDFARQVSGLKSGALGTIDLSNEIFDHQWASARSLGQACSESEIGKFPDGSNIRQFVTTALVAEDMVAIIDRLDEHYKSKYPTESTSSGPALLNYWGFSYGTMLGNTFASMFPHRIGRVILDGVVDAPDYVATAWSTNLQDSMQNWDSFFTYCFAGKAKCPLYKSTYKSASDIKTAVNILLDELKTSPIPLLINGTAEVVRYTDVRSHIFQALYFVTSRFDPLATILSDLIAGNTDSIIPLMPKLAAEGTQPPKALDNITEAWNRGVPPSYPHQMEATSAILCTDGKDITSRTKAEHKAITSQLVALSPISGGVWSEITLACTAWPSRLRARDENRFTGPFTSKLADYDSRASPILWVGNTADPVTPLRNARNMAKAHEGSVVLVQDCAGHCTGPLNPSKETYNVMRKFWAEGVLPKEGTVCKVDNVPWGSSGMLLK